MTHDEAQARADQLNREAPDRRDHWWTISDHGDGEWQVISVTVPGMQFDSRPLNTATEQRPEPDEPPDPRPTITRLIPPYGPS